MIDECGAFDIFGSPDDLKNFVANRNPKTIGVYYSTEKKLI